MPRNIAREHKVEFNRRLATSRPDYRAAKLARDIIVARTESGRDRKARRFVRYADSTIKRKIRKRQQISPVNLRDSGLMMDRMTVRKMPQRGNTFYSTVMPGTMRDRLIMGYHVRGAGRVPQRDPMGLTSIEHAKVARLISRDVRDIRMSRRTQKATLTFKITG